MGAIQVYLDTNTYIGAKYIFENGKLNTLKKLIEEGYVKIIYTSATVGEVKEHIKIDIEGAIKEYNHLIKKKLGTLVEDGKYSNIIKPLNCEEVINYINTNFDLYLSEIGAIQISLNPIDVENLMKNYFLKKPPFEQSKPYEFKDAIMINAIKEYQRKQKIQICLVSSDKGFIKAFEGDENFKLFNYLGKFIKYVNSNIEFNVKIEKIISKQIWHKNIQELIFNYLNNISIECFSTPDWEYDDLQIRSIEKCELNYIDINDNIASANISIASIIELETNFLDLENSYFDKEEERYIITNYVNAKEKHKIYLEVTIDYNIINQNGNIHVELMHIDKDKSDSSIELSEYTMEEIDIIKEILEEEIECVRCSQCGRVLGINANNSYYDYYGEILCYDCAITDNEGEICPHCGRKVPFEYMMSDMCRECFDKQG